MSRWIRLLSLLALWAACQPTPPDTPAALPESPISGEPELVVGTGHTGRVNDVAFSRDSQLMASAAQDGTVRLWDMRLQRELRTLRGHRGGVFSVDFSADGNQLATGGPDGTIRIWNIADGSLSKQLEGHESHVYEVRFTSDGEHLVSEDLQLVAIWDLAKGTPVATILDASSFLLDDARSRLFVERRKGPLTVHAIPSGKELRSFPDEAELRPDWIDEEGKRLLALQRDDGAVGFYDADSGSKLATIRSDRAGTKDPEMPTTTVRPGDGAVVMAWHDRLVIGPGTPERKLLMGATGVLAFSPDGRWLAARGPDPFVVGERGEPFPFDVDARVIRLYDAQSTEPVVDLAPLIPAARPQLLEMFDGFQVAFHPTEPVLASGGIDGVVRLWDLRRGGPPNVLVGHTGPILALAFNPRGNRLASGDPERTLVWDVRPGTIRARLKTAGRSFAFDKTGNLLLVGGLSGEVSQWNVRSGEMLRRDVVHDAPGFSHKDVVAVAFTREEAGLVTAGADRTVGLWNVGMAGIELERRFEGHEKWIFDLDVSPRGDIAIGGGDPLAVSNFKGGLGKRNYIQLIHPVRGAAQLEGHEENVRTLAFSPDGKMLASGSADQTVKLWDMSTGRLLATLEGHDSTVTSLSFSHDGRLLASVSSGGDVRLWSPSRRELVAVLLATGEDGYVMATPDHHYTASRDGLRAVGFRFGRRTAPFELFDLQLNRPDLVLDAIGYASEELVETYRRAHERRLRKMKLAGKRSGEAVRLPVVALNGTPPLATKQRTLELRVRAGDPGGALDRLLVHVNDVPIFGRGGVDLSQMQGSVVEVPVRLELSRGRNKVQVSALNAAGLESFAETFVTTYTGPSEPATLHVLTIGVSRYAEPALDLAYPAKDARDVAELFQRHGERFEKVRVMRILDREVTRDNVVRAKRFFEQSTIDDQVVLFVAGHGLLSPQGAYYFVASNVDPAAPTKTGIPYDDLEGLLDGIPARRKLMLVDTCHSGEVEDADVLEHGSAAQRLPSATGSQAGVKRGKSFRGLTLWKMPVVRSPARTYGALSELFADLRRGTGAMVIASSSGTEFSWEDERWQNGAFTFSVLEGLETRAADANHDGAIQVTELRDYVSMRVQELTGGEQHPTTRRENLSDDFPVF